MHVVSIPVVEIRPYTHNPRGEIRPADVEDLVGLIRTQGLLSPLVVHEVGDKAFEVIAGHRRLAALKVLGETHAMCNVLSPEAAKDFGALCLGENLSHKDLPPFAAAEHVQRLMQRDGLTASAVASQTGMSERWVEQRITLAQLHPKARKAYESEHGVMGHWTLEMLELFAEFPLERQGELLADGNQWWADRLRTASDVSRELGSELRTLKHAPFDIHDATLLPKAGACDGCPNHTHARRTLFGVDDAEAKDLRKATCLLASCFAAKIQAHAERAIAKARAETPGLIVVHGDGRQIAGGEPRADVKGALAPGDYSIVREGAKGAKPAYVVDGKGAGKVVHVALVRDDLAGRKAKAAPEEKKPLTDDDRRAKIQERRDALEVSLIAECTASVQAPIPVTVARLLLVFGVNDALLDLPQTAPEVIKAFDRSGMVDVAWARAVWHGVRDRIETTIRDSVVLAPAEGLGLARWVGKLLGIDLAAVGVQVESEIPTPKALQVKEAPKKAKGRSPKPGKKSTPPAPARARRGRKGKAAAAGDDSAE